MKTSDSIGKISPALISAQRAITFASADAINPHFRSKYADLHSVIEAIKGSLNDNDIMFMQTPSPSEIGTLALTTRLIHVSGEWIEDTAVVPLPKSDPQGYGSALTYARRYALAAMTGLYQDDDDGNLIVKKEPFNAKTEIKTPKAVEAEPDTRPPYRAGVAGDSNGDARDDSAPEIPFGEPPHAAGPNTIRDKQLGFLMIKARAAGMTEAQLDAAILAKFLKKSKKDLTSGEMNNLLESMKNKTVRAG